jgi:hypothetical protein
MTLLQAILTILASLPVPKVDAHEANRIERLNIISAAIASSAERATCSGEYIGIECKAIASEPTQVAAELIVMADRESNLASNVMDDQCGIHQCDPVQYTVAGKMVIRHRARSLWQLHRKPIWSDAKWESLSGASAFAVTAAAWEATKLMAGGHGVCKTTEGAFARYAGDPSCHRKSSAGRAAATVKVKAMLWALTHEGNK